ncbi:MAG: iron ABC transporter permease [Anaerolineae bacterium]|nr:iron ABC transporter permease [Anaerolineae bacterium]
MRQRPGAIGSLLVAGLYLLVVMGPFLALLTDLASVPVSDWLNLAWPNARQLKVWARSIALAGAVAGGGMGLGLLVALALQRWRGGWSAELRWFFVLLAPLPPVTHAMAWAWATGQLNQILARSGLRPLPFQGWFAAWWVQLLWLAPIATGLALVAVESVDSRMTDAARLLQPDFRTLMRVLLPLAGPLLLAGGGILFVLSLVDYAIPSLCQINVTALDIFADFSVHNLPGRALLVSVPLLATTAGVLALSQAQLRPAALEPNWHRATSGVPPAWPPSFRVAIGVALAVMALAVSVPLISLVTQVRSVRGLGMTLSEAHMEIADSLKIAALAGLLSLPLAYAAAHACGVRWQAHPRREQGRAWWLAITLPLALPGPLVGIGLITLWNRPGWTGLGLYGTAWMPVLAALARYTPVGALVLIGALRQINPHLIEAAQLLETRRLRTWVLIHLPLLAPGLLAAAGVVFSLTLGELSATLLVSPPGQPTLTMRIYNYLHYGASDTVAGLTLVLTGLVLVFGLAIAVMLVLWARMAGVERPSLSPPASPVLAWQDGSARMAGKPVETGVRKR